MIIQDASRNELQEILELQYLAFMTEAELLGTTDIPPLKQTISDIEKDFSGGKILIVKNKDKIIASVRMKISGNTVHVGKLMVHPSFRHQGIGSALLKEVEKIYPEKRFEIFTSTLSQDNMNLYKAMGYSIFSERTISDRLSFVFMEKNRRAARENMAVN